MSRSLNCVRTAVLMCLWVLVWSSAGQAVAQRADVVALPSGVRPELQSAVDDLVDHLKQITGRRFKATRDAEAQATASIRLARADGADDLPAGTEALAGHNLEAYRLVGDGSGPVWIIGNSDNAIANGIYAYLEELGVRWLLPTETWTIIPHHESALIQIDRIGSTPFLTRGFFGTGGYGGVLPTDPSREVQQKWEAWQRRLRFTGQYRLGGHSGEAFNTAEKATLEAHPEYRAMIDGQRQPWALSTKFCASNPDALALYTQNRLKALEQQIAKDPDGPQSLAVSVDPADGGGHCECPDCLAIGSGSVSDRVFFYANHVARAVAEQFPGKAVNLYGYNEHAFVPTIDIEPNVIVTLVPYGLHRTGMTPDQFIDAWAEKLDRITVYSYWGIPDWNQNLPGFSFYEQAMPQLQQWRDKGVEMYLLESSTGGGALGFILYSLSHMSWDQTITPQQAMDTFFGEAFGSAAEPMQRMVDRWMHYYLHSEHELGLSYRDIAEAQSLTEDPAVLARINDFKLYLHYMRLRLEYDRLTDNTPESLAKADELLHFLWRAHETTMVQSFRLWQLVVHREETKSSKELLAKWDVKNANAPVWSEVPPITDAQVDAVFDEGMQKYHPLDFDARTFVGEYTAAPTNAEPRPDTAERVETRMMTGELVYELLIPQGQSTFAFDFKCGPSNAIGYPGDYVRLYDAQGQQVYKQLYPADGQWRTIEVPVSEPGRYTLKIYDQKAFCFLRMPTQSAATLVSGLVSADLSARMYFYVPKGQQKIAFYEAGVIPLTVFDATGEEVDLQGQRGVIVLDVPEGQDGQPWSFRGYKSYTPLQMLNLPAGLSYSPDALLVPADAVE